MNSIKKHKRVFVSVGEASGDFHASNLVRGVKKILPDTEFYGMGGKLMRQAGVEIIVDSTDLAVIGGVEILARFTSIMRAMQRVKHELKNNSYDLVILVDYAGFNLRLAKIAKKLGIKVLYYISPKIWAWHQSRVKKVKKYVDMMAVLFPFEVKFYTAAQVPVTLVQHPLLSIVKPQMEIKQAKELFKLDPNAPVVGLFPGSRKGEIKRLLPVMLKTAQLLKARYKNIQFVLPIASSLTEKDLDPHFRTIDNDDILSIKIIKNQTYDVANVCDAVIAASGTVTLEITLLGIPMVIIYKLSALTYRILKMIIKVKYIGLCNIVAEKKIVQELIQDHANSISISNEIIKILDDKEYREQMVSELRSIKDKLSTSSEIKTIEQVVGKML